MRFILSLMACWNCVHAYICLMCVKKDRDNSEHQTDYLLTKGLSLIWMVLSSWLFVLGRLKLLFFLWRREQHEPRPCGDEDSEEVRELGLFTTEISMQLAWNVCSSTNSWFCREKQWKFGFGVPYESLIYIRDQLCWIMDKVVSQWGLSKLSRICFKIVC